MCDINTAAFATVEKGKMRIWLTGSGVDLIKAKDDWTGVYYFREDGKYKGGWWHRSYVKGKQYSVYLCDNEPDQGLDYRHALTLALKQKLPNVAHLLPWDYVRQLEKEGEISFMPQVAF